jgi:hypothetical protein
LQHATVMPNKTTDSDKYKKNDWIGFNFIPCEVYTYIVLSIFSKHLFDYITTKARKTFDEKVKYYKFEDNFIIKALVKTLTTNANIFTKLIKGSSMGSSHTFNIVFIRLASQINITFFLKIQWKQHHILYVKIVYKHNMTCQMVHGQRGYRD